MTRILVLHRSINFHRARYNYHRRHASRVRHIEICAQCLARTFALRVALGDSLRYFVAAHRRGVRDHRAAADGAMPSRFLHS